MARVACRWPGGYTLHIKKTGVPVDKWPTYRLQGPSGEVVTAAMGALSLRSVGAAQMAQDAIGDHLTHLEKTRDHPLHQMQYVENHVPDHFWRQWLAQQEVLGGHHHRHRIVFEIK